MNEWVSESMNEWMNEWMMLFTAEGRSAAAMYSCKYIEVSATIDLHIDSLFVGVIRHIRSLRRHRDSNHRRRSHHHSQRNKRNNLSRPTFRRLMLLLYHLSNFCPLFSRILKSSNSTYSICCGFVVQQAIQQIHSKSTASPQQVHNRSKRCRTNPQQIK